MAAIRTLRELGDEPASREQQAVLSRWSGWGAVPDVFDERTQAWAAERAALLDLLGPTAYSEARTTTLNAHYTDVGYIREMWTALEELGFTGGDVLEPGTGLGSFIGLAPESANMVGIELDSTTAAIAQKLYPNATIHAENFRKTRRYPREHFDAVIGNVPFGSISMPIDGPFTKQQASLHNYFILKSLALTRPGGMAAVITSSYTMDAVSTSARREMAEMADLVGAVRLPTGAHKRAAGTDVVTDILIFRRREEDAPAREEEPEWVRTAEMVLPVSNRNLDEAVADHTMNAYFVSHPEQVLGAMSLGQGMYGAKTLAVTSDDLAAVPDQLRARLGVVTSAAVQRGAVFTEVTTEEAAKRQIRAANTAIASELYDGTIVEVNGVFQRVRAGELHRLTVRVDARTELRALLAMRDSARNLVLNEGRYPEGDSPELEQQRTMLRQQWEQYTAEYGPVNRFVPGPLKKETIVDPETGEDAEVWVETKILPHAVQSLRKDPFGPVVLGLERFDEQSQTARPAPILLQRTVTPRSELTATDSPTEALTASVAMHGVVDPDYISGLLRRDWEGIAAELSDAGSIFEDPREPDVWITAPAYLSGNIRVKLRDAEAAAEAATAEGADPGRWERNITSLREVIPPLVPIEDITVKVGSAWISPEEHQEFLRSVLRHRNIEITRSADPNTTAAWKVKYRGLSNNIRATSTYGTDRKNAAQILESLLNKGTPPLVKDTLQDGKTVLNPTATAEVEEKAEVLVEAFNAWIWADSERCQRLVERFNVQFNSLVKRDYTAEGERLLLPGLVGKFSNGLRPHQRTAVARMLHEPTAGLFHEVGAGKTLEMVVGTMELRRIGAVTKPMVIVPNHMLDQFTKEWLEAYPAANILTSANVSNVANRHEFVAQCAMNDWDAIITTHSTFKLINLKPETLLAQLEKLDADIRAENGDDSVKSIETAIARAKAKIRENDNVGGITFEDTGVDYLVVDEAHTFKNLVTPGPTGLDIEGSYAALDLEQKLQYFRNRGQERVATFATATPISNSITEAHIMARFLAPEALERAGVRRFTDWLSTFAETVSKTEISVDGTFKNKERIARFQNLPEMMQLWTFADIKTAEDLNLPTPELSPRPDDQERRAEMVAIPSSQDLTAYMQEIANRSGRITRGEVEREEDNMLNISTDGRKAGLDMRLVDPSLEMTEVTKLDVMADHIAAEWEATRNNVYLDVDGEEHPRTGGLQLVFIDMSVPRAEWNAYDQLRDNLVERGMPRESVRFIHEATNNSDKGRLFEAARTGEVSVLIGSTAKMGVGTNVQTRATTIHHADSPWRPADVEQRNGRIRRQGNQNAEYREKRYVTERSFDGFMWQTVARKAAMIHQVLNNKGERTAEEISQSELEASQASAIGAGNPLLLDHADAQMELKKLQTKERAHNNAQKSVHIQLSAAEFKIESLGHDLAVLQRAMERTVDVSGKKFEINILGTQFTDRMLAAAAAAAYVAQQDERPSTKHWWRAPEFADIGGHTISVEYGAEKSAEFVSLSIAGVPGTTTPYPIKMMREGSIGFITTIHNKAASVPSLYKKAQDTLEATKNDLAELQGKVGAPFKYQAELAEAKSNLARIKRLLAESAIHPGDVTIGATPHIKVQERVLVTLNAGNPHFLPDDFLEALAPAVESAKQHYRADLAATDTSRVGEDGEPIPVPNVIDTTVRYRGHDYTVSIAINPENVDALPNIRVTDLAAADGPTPPTARDLLRGSEPPSLGGGSASDNDKWNRPNSPDHDLGDDNGTER